VTIATPLEAVEEFNAAWAVGDVDAAMSWAAENCVYALYISGELLPHGGETFGREKIGAALRQVRVDFDYLLYRPMHLQAKDDVVRFQVEFMYRHRQSGEMLSGRFRFVMRVKEGLIIRADEYHDRAKVEAFMRLFGHP
jgi:ketosteroid isomerase-like protein